MTPEIIIEYLNSHRQDYDEARDDGYVIKGAKEWNEKIDQAIALFN